MKKKKSRYFFRILFFLFLIFIALIIAYESGYYETKASNRATLTKEAMLEFEHDLEEGKVIDVKDYLVDERVDYSNNVTKFGNKITGSVSDIMTKGITGIFDALKSLFW
ncbi:MAG: hypothetical protein K2J20_03305 [Bacilli bacterium]|nr:hypothetical protein [Bacilli bacterium]